MHFPCFIFYLICCCFTNFKFCTSSNEFSFSQIPYRRRPPSVCTKCRPSLRRGFFSRNISERRQRDAGRHRQVRMWVCQSKAAACFADMCLICVWTAPGGLYHEASSTGKLVTQSWLATLRQLIYLCSSEHVQEKVRQLIIRHYQKHEWGR